MSEEAQKTVDTIGDAAEDTAGAADNLVDEVITDTLTGENNDIIIDYTTGAGVGGPAGGVANAGKEYVDDKIDSMAMPGMPEDPNKEQKEKAKNIAETEDKKERVQRAKAVQRKSSGRSSTLLTGSRGLMDKPATSRRFLTG